jgi:hypothetical protein
LLSRDLFLQTGNKEWPQKEERGIAEKSSKSTKRKQGRTAVSFEPLKRLKLYLAFAIEEGATR